MKKLQLTLLLISFFSLFSTTKKDSKPHTETPSSEYAMTAKLNGDYYEMNNMFGYNEATQPDINFYLSEDFIELRGRKLTKNGVFEIYLWIAKTDLKTGTYFINSNAMISNQTHAGLAYRSSNTTPNRVYRETLTGKIEITKIDTVNKTVKGYFEFKATPKKQDINAPSFTITDGAFNYIYDVKDNSIDF